jgi:hypothetical protein
MSRFLLVLAQVCLVIGPTNPVAEAVGTEPEVTLVGGGDAERALVLAAVDRFASVGLDLPDLVIRMHPDTHGCGGKQGLFQARADIGVIDLCFSREFLVLHELGHAWEHFALDDRDRAGFLRATGFETWRSRDVPWSRRGIERVADSIAHGLLSAPLATPHHRDREFERFALLTGFTTPRLNEI